MFEVAQKVGACEDATGGGGDHHQADIGICRGGVTEGQFGERHKARVEQTEAQAGGGVAAGWSRR